MRASFCAVALSLSLFLAVITNPAEAGKFQCISTLRPAGMLRPSEFFTQTLNSLSLTDDDKDEQLHIKAKELSTAVDPVFHAIQNRETTLKWNGMTLVLSYSHPTASQATGRVTLSGAFRGVWAAEFELSSPLTREAVAKELDQKVTFQIKDSHSIVGYGDVVFDANQRKVEFRKLYLLKPFRGRSIGSSLLRAIHDATGKGTTLSLVCTNEETNSVLLPILSEVWASPAYRTTQRTLGQPAATRFSEFEVARRAAELVESDRKWVWLRALRNSGWAVDRIGFVIIGPLIYARWQEKRDTEN